MLYEQRVLLRWNAACQLVLSPLDGWWSFFLCIEPSLCSALTCACAVRVLSHTVQTPWCSTSMSLSKRCEVHHAEHAVEHIFDVGFVDCGSNVEQRSSSMVGCPTVRAHIFSILCLHCLGLRCTVESECFASVGRIF